MSMRALLGVPGALAGQKRALHPLELELQMVSGHVGAGKPSKSGFSARAASAHNHRAIFLVKVFNFDVIYFCQFSIIVCAYFS